MGQSVIIVFIALQNQSAPSQMTKWYHYQRHSVLFFKKAFYFLPFFGLELESIKHQIIRAKMSNYTCKLRSRLKERIMFITHLKPLQPKTDITDDLVD
jgi:hypothetical protein